MTVDDDGPGIPLEFLPRIFTPFARANAASGQDLLADQGDPTHDESVGLGLGLAHGLMIAMTGDLSVGSPTTAGTSMVLRIPRAEMSAR